MIDNNIMNSMNNINLSRGVEVENYEVLCDEAQVSSCILSTGINDVKITFGL